ncbi:MAG: hypothetical protein C0408_03945, partial [Odoribacter sp.]|nr:hypothetical protein [Odoribacter sp.]
MDKILKILFVEDLITDAELIWHEIKKNKIAFKKLLVDNKVDFIEGINTFDPDIIISDYSMPQFDGMNALIIRNELAPLIPFILVTGSVNEEVAADCIKTGADDYILKSNLTRLVPAIVNSINKTKVLNEKKNAEEALKRSLSLTEATLDSIHNGILVVSNEGRVIKTNAKFAEMWNIPDDILASNDDKALLDSVLEQVEDPDEFVARVAELYEKPGAESTDLIYFKDGRIFERISKPMYLGSKPMGRV